MQPDPDADIAQKNSGHIEVAYTEAYKIMRFFVKIMRYSI